jgi:holo-[acyl-carrier protein] synthase
MTTPSLRVGIDLVQVSRIEESLARFGDRFLRRVFTEDEVASATPHTAARLAARFAAKEATIKALGLVEEASPWREIEVRRAASGACAIALHGSIRDAAHRLGAGAFSLSVSHEGDYATAVVITSVQPTH